MKPQLEAEAGMTCAVTGLTETYPGEGLGAEEESELPVLEPVLVIGSDCRRTAMYIKCFKLFGFWRRKSRFFILYGTKAWEKSMHSLWERYRSRC